MSVLEFWVWFNHCWINLKFHIFRTNCPCGSCHFSSKSRTSQSRCTNICAPLKDTVPYRLIGFTIKNIILVIVDIVTDIITSIQLIGDADTFLWGIISLSLIFVPAIIAFLVEFFSCNFKKSLLAFVRHLPMAQPFVHSQYLNREAATKNIMLGCYMSIYLFFQRNSANKTYFH